ncbi:MAG: hypothetical protein M1376_22400, partial [Planctomycetes bacterium]|nr:hypothetical protein [Planctomycetota bacterium]
WGGGATLRDVSARMPLSGDVVFRANRMEVELSAVPLLLLGRPLRVYSLTLDRPTVFLGQGENGRWNAQDVWEQVQAGIGSPLQRVGETRLPEVVVRDATIRITDSGGTTQTVGPLDFDGRRQGRVLWAFELRALPSAEITGQVVEGSDWAHEVRFSAQGIGPLVGRLLQRDFTPIRLAGRWKGSLTRGALQGALQLDECIVARATLQGGAQIAVMPDGVTIRPRDLTVSEPNSAEETIRLMDGAVEITREGIALESLAAKARAVGARIDGRWNWQTRRGEFSGSWAAAEPDRLSQYDGTCRLAVASPRWGRKEVRANVALQARTPLGSWQAAAEAQASGAEWRLSQGQVKVPAFSWVRGGRRVDVTDVAARVELHWPEIRLMSPSLPAADQVDGQAQFDADTRQWSARMAVQQWHGPALGTTGLDLRLSAAGDDKEARISEFRVAFEESVVTVEGGLSLVTWDLQKANLSASGPAHVLHLGGTSPALGRWRLEAGVTGQIRPVALEADATLAGQDLTLGKRRVDRVQIPLHVRADARQVEATTQPFDLLGGQWQATGRYELSGRATQIDVLAANLSLAAVAEMAGLPLASQGQARAALALRMPGLEIRKAVAAGSWSARDIRIPPLVAHQAQGALRIAGGLVQLEDIRLERQDGRADAKASFRLDEPEVVSLELSTHRWPLPWDGRSATVVVDGRTGLRMNVVKKTAEGEAQLTAKVLWQDKNLADVRLAALVQGQTVKVREFHAQVLGGTVDGTAVVPLNRWTDSVAQLRWRAIQLPQLETWLPAPRRAAALQALARLQGTMSGSLLVEQTHRPQAPGQRTEDRRPVTEPSSAVGPPPSEIHPLGPLRFALDTHIAGGRLGPAQIGLCQATGYLDPKRLLIENARFDVLGGRLDAQARLSRRAGTFYGAVVADFNELNLDQLVHALDPNAGAHPGRLAGRVTVLPAFERGILLSGGGWVRLTESDLADNPIVRSLYNTLNLHFGSQEPKGTGEVEFQLQGPAIVLSSVQYFNRGVEIRGAGRIENINLGADSPVEGYAVASTRVLKGVKLPGVRTLDRLLGALQTGAGSVKIAGAVDNMQVRVVPFPEILDPFRRLLWTQLRE